MSIRSDEWGDALSYNNQLLSIDSNKIIHWNNGDIGTWFVDSDIHVDPITNGPKSANAASFTSIIYTNSNNEYILLTFGEQSMNFMEFNFETNEWRDLKEVKEYNIEKDLSFGYEPKISFLGTHDELMLICSGYDYTKPYQVIIYDYNNHKILKNYKKIYDKNLKGAKKFHLIRTNQNEFMLFSPFVFQYLSIDVATLEMTKKKENFENMFNASDDCWFLSRYRCLSDYTIIQLSMNYLLLIGGIGFPHIGNSKIDNVSPLCYDIVQKKWYQGDGRMNGYGQNTLYEKETNMIHIFNRYVYYNCYVSDILPFWNKFDLIVTYFYRKQNTNESMVWTSDITEHILEFIN